jgi:hypothetical protein
MRLSVLDSLSVLIDLIRAAKGTGKREQCVHLTYAN